MKYQEANGFRFLEVINNEMVIFNHTKSSENHFSAKVLKVEIIENSHYLPSTTYKYIINDKESNLNAIALVFYDSGRIALRKYEKGPNGISYINRVCDLVQVED